MKSSSAKSKRPQRSNEQKPVSVNNLKNDKFSVITGYVLAGSVTLLIGILATSKLFIDDDVFWHLATGRYITGNGFVVPSYDVFGYVTAGVLWIPFEWGWDVMTFYLNSWGGYFLLSVLRLLLVLAVFVPLYFTAKRSELPLSIFSVIEIILSFGMLVRFSVRPQLISYAFFVILIYLLYSVYIYKKNIKLLYLLPVMFLIWANMHMGVLLGAGILILFTVSMLIQNSIAKKNKEVDSLSQADRMKLFIITGLSIAALFINPHFVQTYIYAVSHSQMDSLEDIQEWKSPFDAKFSSFYYIKIYYFYLCLVIPMLYYSYRKKDIFTGLLVIAIAVYSTQSLRFIYDYMVVITIPAMISLAWLIGLMQKKITNRLFESMYANVILILITAYMVINTYNNSIYKEQLGNKFRETGTGINEDFYPVQMAEFMKKEKITEIGSNPFNNLRMGGFFVWNFEGKRNFIDSRNLNNEIMAEYKSIDQRQNGFEDKLGKYGVDYIMYSMPYLTTNAGDIEKNLIAYLSKSVKWKLVFWDDKSFLFVRNEAKFAEVIYKYEYKYLTPSNYIFRKNIITDALKNDRSRVNSEAVRKKQEEPGGRLINDMIMKLGL